MSQSAIVDCDPAVVLLERCLQKLTRVRSKPLGAEVLREAVCVLLRCLLEATSLHELVEPVQILSRAHPRAPPGSPLSSPVATSRVTAHV